MPHNALRYADSFGGCADEKFRYETCLRAECMSCTFAKSYPEDNMTLVLKCNVKLIAPSTNNGAVQQLCVVMLVGESQCPTFSFFLF